ncbi:MAG: hypothetical protein ACQSGP_26915 [Frankia sp.]
MTVAPAADSVRATVSCMSSGYGVIRPIDRAPARSTASRRASVAVVAVVAGTPVTAVMAPP